MDDGIAHVPLSGLEHSMVHPTNLGKLTKGNLDSHVGGVSKEDILDYKAKNPLSNDQCLTSLPLPVP